MNFPNIFQKKLDAVLEVHPTQPCSVFHFFMLAGDQLISSRISDDNFYNRRNDEVGEKIAKTVEMYSAARFICDNTKLKKVQRNIFLVPSPE